MTGTTDFSEIAVENPPSEAHKLAFDILVDRILGYIGNYYVKLGGEIDALVFAGGIGEKSALLRRTLSEKCKSLGIAIDSQANDKGAEDDETVKDISKGAGKGPRVLICQTNEQVSQYVTSAADTRSLILVPQYEMAYHCIRERS